MMLGGLDFPLRIIDQASATIDKVNQKLNQTASASKGVAGSQSQAADASKNMAVGLGSAGVSLSAMNVAALGAVAAIGAATLAMKGMYSTAREGASLDFTREKFNRLSAAVGTTSDTLLGRMNVAVKGTMSTFQSMAAVTDLMSLGLADNADQAVRLAAVQGALGMDMNQLVLTLTNMTTRRFDQLGVSVDGFKERLAGLKETGLSTEDAFKEAFLQQAEAQLKRVGNAADSTLGSYKRFEAQIYNVTESLKQQVAVALLPAVDAMVKLGDAAEVASLAQKAGGLPSRQQFQFKVNEAIAQPGALAATPGLGQQMWQQYEDEMARYTAWMQKGQAATAFFQAQVEKTNVAIGVNLTDSLKRVSTLVSGELGSAYDQFLDRRKKIEEELAKEKDPTKRTNLASQLDEETAAYQRRASAIMFNIQQEQILASGLSDTQKGAAIANLAEGYGLMDEKTRIVYDSTARLIDMYDRGVVTEQQFISMLQGQTPALLGVGIGLEQSAMVADRFAQSTKGASTAEEMLGNNVVTTAQQATSAAAAHKEAIPSLDAYGNSVKSTGQQASYAAGETSSLIAKIEQLDGMTATATITILIYGSGELGALGKQLGAAQGSKLVNTYSGYKGKSSFSGYKAGGGQWHPGEWAVVGDLPGGVLTPYSELISPTGFIVPAKETRALFDAGLIPRNIPSYAFEESGGLSGSIKTVAGRHGRQSEYVSGRGGGAASGASATRSTREFVSDAVAAEIAPLETSTKTAFSAITNASQEQNVIGSEQLAESKAGNSEQADIQKEMLAALRRLPDERAMHRIFRNAIQTGNVSG